MSIIHRRRRSVIAAVSGFDADKRRARYQQKRADKEVKMREMIEAVKSADGDPEKQIDILFEELVPSSGPAKSLAGELARACMRILYRDYNDGDVFYDGYGLETCGPCAQFILNNVEESYDIITEIGENGLRDSAYTRGLNALAECVVNYILTNPDSFKQTADDCLDTELVEIADMAPEYEFDVDTSGDLEAYIDNDCISWSDVEYFLSNLCDYYGGEVNSWARDAFTIVGLNGDQLDEWEHMYEKELLSWLDELEAEYPNYGQDEDEDEDW